MVGGFSLYKSHVDLVTSFYVKNTQEQKPCERYKAVCDLNIGQAPFCTERGGVPMVGWLSCPFMLRSMNAYVVSSGRL